MIDAARRGDPAARARLVELLAGPVYRFGRSFCRDADDADDVLQDVLLKLLEELPHFRGESALSTWAFVVARRTCALRKRRAARATPLDGDAGRKARTLPDPGETPEREAERGELRAALERAIAGLPPAQREVLLLRDVEGRSAAEVARALRLGERAVKSRLHRARLALRAALAPEHLGERRLGCPDIARLASRALEGEIDAATCRKLAAHARTCPDCARAYHGFERVRSRCGAWGQAALPGRVARRLRSGVFGKR